MTHASVFMLSLAGFVSLYLSMRRHQGDWLRRPLPPLIGRALRLSGFVALGTALLAAIAGFGFGYGLVSWLGWLSAAAAAALFMQLMHQGRSCGPSRRTPS